MDRINRSCIETADGKKIIDIHTHSIGMDIYGLLRGGYPITQDITDLRNTCLNNGVSYIVTFPMPTTLYYDYSNFSYGSRNSIKSSGMQGIPFQYENCSLLKTIDRLKYKEFLPFLSISLREKVDAQIDSIYMLNDQYNVYGLKYHPFRDLSMVTDEAFLRFADLAETLNIPIIIHSGTSIYDDVAGIFNIIEKHPKLRVCIAHAGFFKKAFIDRLCKDDSNNLFIDCSPLSILCKQVKKLKDSNNIEISNFSYDNPIIMVEELLHSEFGGKLLWGSDSPWYRKIDSVSGNYNSYEEEISIIKNNESFIKRIYENSLSYLFGCEGTPI